MKIRYCIFNKCPWFVLGWCMADDSNGLTWYEDAMRQAKERCPDQDVTVAPSLRG